MQRTIRLVLLTGGLLAATASIPAADAPKPNILLFYADNVGYCDLACYGNPDNLTPNLDRLAAEGVRCTDFYVAAPSCTPSRGALLTGRHPLRNGLAHQLRAEENWHGIGLPHRERLLPQYLKPADYATGCFGKWNIGFAPGSRPTERGFDEFLGCRSGNIHYFKHLYRGEYDLRQGVAPVDRRGEYATDLFADAAADFIKSHCERRWFLYLPFNAVHFVSAINTEPGEEPEWQAPAEHLALYGHPPNERDPQRRFRAVLTAMDAAIGRVLTTVDDLGLRDRTLALFLSDNGAFMLKDRGLEVQSNAPLRSGGTTSYEGGVRVPAILRWPGRLPAGTVCRAMLSHLDLLPLFLNAAGVTPPADRVLDGRDPLAALAGTAGSPHQRLAFSYGGSVGMREGDLKIVRPKPSSPWELYDLAADPGENNDLARDRAADLERLVSNFEAWLQDAKRDASAPAPYGP